MQPKPILLTILDIVTLILLVFASVMVFAYAPQEAVMGNVQKVFYFHVAAGWVGMLSFMAAFIAGIGFLVSKDRKWDLAGVAAVELGWIFSFINVVTGSIWARPAWNTWWTWDPRLTTATIMLLIYAAYMMLRQGLEDPDRHARFGAVYAIIGFISVPLSFFSIRIFRTIHPVVVRGANTAATEAMGAFSMTPKMRTVFFLSLFVFSVIFVDLLWHRLRLGKLADHVEEMKMKVLS